MVMSPAWSNEQQIKKAVAVGSRSETTTGNIFEMLLTLSSQTGMGKFHQCCISRLVILIRGKTLSFPTDCHHNLYDDDENIPPQRNSLCSLRTGYAYIVLVVPIKNAYYLKLYTACIQLDQPTSNQQTFMCNNPQYS